jgi:pimeloyl-ACP methyl ester carboxylesterase
VTEGYAKAHISDSPRAQVKEIGRPHEEHSLDGGRCLGEIRGEVAMHEFFPGNYRWSYNTLLAFCGGGQVGDVARVLERLQSTTDDAAWHEAWQEIADVATRRATQATHPRSAWQHHLLASLYGVISEHFIPPGSPQRLATYRKALASFDAARALAPYPVERVEVPYEGASLPGYYVAARGGKAKKQPAAIFICGLDTTKELWFLRARDEFSERGIACLFLDTPGIGEAVRMRSMPTRYDYEKPVAAAIDWLSARADIDPARIALVGSSLGGYYVTRGAAYEPRVAAAVAWGVIYDYAAVWLWRRSSGASVAAPSFQLMFITGTKTVEDAERAIEHFHTRDCGPLVRCPFLIMHGSDDRQVPPGHAQAMHESIGSRDKQLLVFDGDNGGSAHCQFDNHLPALLACADWLGERLKVSNGDHK